MLSASLTWALFLPPLCLGLCSPGALAADLESVDYTCSLVAIIRGVTQRLSVGEDESALKGLDRESLAVFNENQRPDTV